LRLDFFAGAASPAAAGAAAASAAAAFLLFFFDLVVVLSVWVAVASSAASAFFFFLAHAGVAARLSAKPSTAAHANNLMLNGFISEFLFIFILDAVSGGLPQAQRGGQSPVRTSFAPEPYKQIGLIVSEAVNHAKSRDDSQ
jgi:hypothetical protein